MHADRNTSTYFDNVRVPREWGLKGPVAWSIFETASSAPFPLNSGHMVGILQGAFDVLLDYTGQRVAGGRLINQHLDAAMILGEMASLITVGRAAFLELAHEFDHMDIYGMWNTNSMVAKGHAVHAYITRAASEMILRGMELMGSLWICSRKPLREILPGCTGSQTGYGWQSPGLFCRVPAILRP